MTDTQLTIIIAAIVPTIAALGAMVVGVVNALRANKTDAKVDVVAGHVNSAASKSAAEIEALRKEVTTLTAGIAERKEIASLLAQAAANPPVQPAQPPTP